MAASPPWKVYVDREYIASFKYPEDAARFIDAGGTEVRFGHSLVVWVEGSEEQSAMESFDSAAAIMRERAGLITQEEDL